MDKIAFFTPKFKRLQSYVWYQMIKKKTKDVRVGVIWST